MAPTGRREPQPSQQRAGRDQHVVPAADALDPDEVGRAEILDGGGANCHHQPERYGWNYNAPS